MAEDKLDEDLDLGIEKEPGSKKKLIIIIAGVLLLLIVGGGAAWFFLSGDDDESAPEEEQETVTEEKAPAIYHALEPVFIVNLPTGGKVKMLQVGMQVMARNPETIAFIKHNDPMIRHNLLSLFGAQESTKLSDRSGKEKLQAEVLKVLNNIIKEQSGPGEIEAAFFTAFVMQ